MIRVAYTCGMCHVVERDVMVAERTVLQDAGQWVSGTVAWAVAEDHARTSPLCRARSMRRLRLPTLEGVGLGRAG